MKKILTDQSMAPDSALTQKYEEDNASLTKSIVAKTQSKKYEKVTRLATSSNAVSTLLQSNN